MDVISTKLFLYIVIVLSAVFHEYAHGFIAYKLGDSTAKDAGRLTLNPLVHIDLMGTVLLPLFLLFYGGIFLGWAKPVPYNPFNLNDKKYGSLKVGSAGPSANLLIAFILGIFLRIISIGALGYIFSPLFLVAVSIIVYINIFLALFNLIPLPPLDGSKVLADLLPRRRWAILQSTGFFGIFLALILAFFILPPIARLLFWLITGQGFGF